MNIKNVFIKIFEIIFLVLVFLNFSYLANGLLVNATENNGYVSTEKIYADIDVNDNFDETSVIVILDRIISGINKDHSLTVFKNINYLEIIDLTFVNDVTTILDIDNFEQILKIKLVNPGKENVINMINELSLIKGIKYAGPNRYLQVQQHPNDPLYTSSISDLKGQWAHENIDSESAWDFSTGNSDIRIGVIDSGVALHEDLNVNVATGYDFVNMIKDGTPGLLRDDASGHGTHVAGIIGAAGSQTPSLGIVGVNWNITIVPMQVGLPNGSVDSTACVSAINFAREKWNTEERISILSMSISGYTEWPEIECAIRKYQGLFVCATGNIEQDNDVPSQYNYPSFYGSSLYDNPLPNLISVGRSDINNERPMNEGANWGQNTISLYAPGQYILSTYPESICLNHNQIFYDGTRMCELKIDIRLMVYVYINSGQYTLNEMLNEFNLIFGKSPSSFTSSDHHSNGYHYMSGSSMSTPYVSGVAALLLSLNKDLTTQQLKDAILNSAETITITLPDDTTQNVKKLNAFNAVKYVLENYVITTYTVSNSIIETEINKTVVSGASYFNELNGFYKLNITESKNYEFKLSSNSAIELVLYDEDFNEIEYMDLDSNSNKIHILKLLASGKYYLRTKYANETSSGTISINIVSSRNYNVTLGNNDILLNTYNYDNDITQSNVYSMHIDENEFGFYKFELVGYTSSGNEIGCLSSTIVVKDSEQNIIDRIEYDGYLSLASNEEFENSFVVSLNEEGYIYIFIEVDTSGLNSLYLNIYPAEFEAIDLFDMYDNYDECINIIENESTYGDYFKKITLNQSARFFVELANFSNLDDKVLFVLSKLNYNSANGSYSLENIVMELMPYDEREFTYVLDLSKGTYFVGYFNKDDSSLFNLKFTRVVSEFSTTKLVSDPDSLSLYGSEVRYNDGDLRGNTITVGFTRILYLDYNLDVPSYSITSFDLFVSDSSVATVSAYGTMLARRSGTVDVIAIYKSNPSIIYSKTFTVLEETRTDDLIINISDEIENFDGEYLYQISLNDLNCPYPQNILYGWSIVQSNYDLTVSLYGSVRLMGEDVIIIEGRYSLNPKVVIRLTLTVN